MIRFVSILFLLIYAECPAEAQSLMNMTQLTNAPEYKNVRIALPADSPSDAKYNTIYVLDADYMFDLVVAMTGYLQYNEMIPPTAVVAVDYTQPEKRIDLGFNINSLSLTKNGEQFYRYISDCLIPIVEKAIPSSGYRVVMGHSYTATYLLEHLKRENPAFRSYLLFAPECSDQALNKSNYPAEYLKDRSVYIIAGDKDVDARLEFATKLYDLLRQSGAKTDLRIAPNAGHMDVIASQMPDMISLLYTGYWTSDSVYGSDFKEGMTLPDIYVMTDKDNRKNFSQSNLLSASNIICYLGRAITSKDTSAIDYFTDYYQKRLDSVSYIHPNALSTYADLMAKNKNYALAERFMIRALQEYDRQGLDHQTWYPRQTFALNILAPMNQPSQAWEVLDHCKNIFEDDRDAFSYYQALLAERCNYRVGDAICLLENALLAPQVLSENYISTDEAQKLLERLRLLNKREQSELVSQ